MDSYRIIRNIDDDIKINKQILNWNTKGEKFLNITTLPYNSPSIFIDIIIKYITLGKIVLYITNEMEAYIKIIESIKKHTDFRGYAYLRNKKFNANLPLVISSHENARNFSGIYDLVIYDDINCLPKYNKDEIKDLMLSRSDDASKLIAFSVEEVFQNSKEIIIPVRCDKKPLLEPRIITTRVDINKNIPYVIFDYIKWLIGSDRKVIIYVPDSDKVDYTFTYLKDICADLCSNIMYYHRGKSEQKTLINFSKTKCSILITDDYECEHFLSERCDIMVYFSDHSAFDYKKLVHFCGKTGWIKNTGKGEIIFLANTESEDMTRAKSIARNFNKEAWDLGLLNI